MANQQNIERQRAPMSAVRRLAKGLAFAGLDPRKIIAIRHLPRYFRDRRLFSRLGGAVKCTAMVLDDYDDFAGSIRGHYFYQDLLVARYIFAAQPRRHVDVGSRVDGFVAHVASFRTIDVFDIRPLSTLDLDGINFVRGDLMQLDPALHEMCDSLSCLHALEHFGLGRYGDPIDPDGHRKGFESLHAMLKPGGMLYLSLPIGRVGVHFNAHRVFDSCDVVAWSAGLFNVERFDVIDDSGRLHLDQSLPAPVLEYGCGIYSLRKRA